MGLFNETDRLHGRKSKPEAVVRVASFPRGHQVKSRIEDITRATEKDDLEFETESSHIGRSREDIKKLYENWRQDFERKKSGAKLVPRHATYIVLHTKAPNDPISAYKVNTAARDFLQKEFGVHGFQYVFAIPLDKQHQHVHVVVKNYNRELDTKLRLDRHDLLDLRRSFAAELGKQGVIEELYNGLLRRSR